LAGGFENLLGTLDTVYLTGDTSKKVGLYFDVNDATYIFGYPVLIPNYRYKWSVDGLWPLQSTVK